MRSHLPLLGCAALAAGLPRSAPVELGECSGLGSAGVALSGSYVLGATGFASGRLSVAKLTDGGALVCGRTRIERDGYNANNAVVAVSNDNLFARAYFVIAGKSDSSAFVELLRAELDTDGNPAVTRCGSPLNVSSGSAVQLMASQQRPDGTTVLVVNLGDGGQVITAHRNTSTGECKLTKVAALPHKTRAFQTMALSADGRTLGMAGGDGQEMAILKLDESGAPSGSLMYLPQLMPKSYGVAAGMNRNGTLLLVGYVSTNAIGPGHAIHVYDLSMGADKATIRWKVDNPSDFRSNAQAVALSADGDVFASGNLVCRAQDSTCTTWSNAGFSSSDNFLRLAFGPPGSPSENKLVLSSDAGVLAVAMLHCPQGTLVDGDGCRMCQDSDLSQKCDGVFTTLSDGKCGCRLCDVALDCSSGASRSYPGPGRLSCQCECTNQWVGPKCSTCPGNYRGDNCDQCGYWQGPAYPNCSVRCTKEMMGCGRGTTSLNLDCTCNCGWDFAGDKCEECSGDHRGENCTECRDGMHPFDVPEGDDWANMVVTCVDDWDSDVWLPLRIILGIAAAVSLVSLVVIIILRRRRLQQMRQQGGYVVAGAQPYYGQPQPYAMPAGGAYAQPAPMQGQPVYGAPGQPVYGVPYAVQPQYPGGPVPVAQPVGCTTQEPLAPHAD